MMCSNCQTEMDHGALYVRGIGGSLHWSNRNDVGILSRKDLSQINLNKISITPVGKQAVLESWRCTACSMIMFKGDTSGGE